MEVNGAAAFLLALIPLVVIHEFGHFLMAKLGGIHVSKFCIGFGKKLFGFHYKGTEYCWNLLPLGGYVDFMGELVYTGKIPNDVRHFYNRPKWIRFLVLVMGPLFNLIMAFGLYWVYHTIRPVYEPINIGQYQVGEVKEDSPEFLAGLRVGDKIKTVQGDPVENWFDLETTISLTPEKDMTLEVMRDGESVVLTYTVSSDPIEGYGLMHFGPDNLIQLGNPSPGSPAEKAGLAARDLLLEIDGKPLTYNTRKILDETLAANAPNASTLTLSRDGENYDVEIIPVLMTDAEGKERFMAGISYGIHHTVRDLNPVEAIGEAWSTFKTSSTVLFEAVRKLVTMALPLKMLSGPVGVAQAAKKALERGWPTFIWMVAFLSLNLGIMNLLPIPVLDGGEIFVLLVEGITRRDFSLDTKMRIKMVGLFILISLMSFVIISDIIKIIKA